jgi:hypothetical protein
MLRGLNFGEQRESLFRMWLVEDSSGNNSKGKAGLTFDGTSILMRLHFYIVLYRSTSRT